MIRLVFDDGTSLALDLRKTLRRIELGDGRRIEWEKVEREATTLLVPADRKKLLDENIEALDLSVRCKNGIFHAFEHQENRKKAGLPMFDSSNGLSSRDVLVRHVVRLSYVDYLKLPFMGRKSCDDLVKALQERGLTLEMTQDQIRQIDEGL